MSETPTFSRQVKDEICQLIRQDEDNQKLSLLAALFAAGRIRPGTVQISTSHQPFADLIEELFEELYQEKLTRQSGRELISLSSDNRLVYKRITDDLRRIFGYDNVLNNLDENRQMSVRQIQTAVRSMFMAGGSLGDPRNAYHLEFALRRLPAAIWLKKQLIYLEISAHFLRRQGYSIVYVKDGQQISELLLQCGAHNSLLEFESLRVEKEMRNSVNRVVNCDSANSQRIANASARQLELFRYLNEHQGLGFLPDELQMAARARLENPDYSLKELGEIMSPPLGKSGMNHRLKKIEKIADELIAKNRKSE